MFGKIKTAIYREEHFNAAHRLHNENLSDEENRILFGKCNNPNYHGHNYRLVVKISGEVDQKTGYVIDTKILSDLIKTEIIEAFDHKNLNLDVLEFKAVNPTAENIAFVIFTKLSAKLNLKYDLKIRLYETERNYVDYPA